MTTLTGETLSKLVITIMTVRQQQQQQQQQLLMDIPLCLANYQYHHKYKHNHFIIKQYNLFYKTLQLSTRSVHRRANKTIQKRVVVYSYNFWRRI